MGRSISTDHIMTKFVGVRNSPHKKKLIAQGSIRGDIVSTEELTFDCMRHLEFLDHYENHGPQADFSSTLYWRFMISFGRTPNSAQAKCERFGQLYESLKGQQLDREIGRIKITQDGIRLDGSHRSAVAKFLGIDSLEVDIFQWKGLLRYVDPGRMKLEANTKRDLQEKYLGKNIFHSSDNRYLGKVVFVEAWSPEYSPPNRFTWLFSRKPDPWMAVAEGTGPVQILPLADLIMC